MPDASQSWYMQLGTMRQADFRRLQVLYREAYVKCLAAGGNRYDLALPAVQRLVRCAAVLLQECLYLTIAGFL